MSKTLDNQLFDIAEVLSGNSGYPIPSRPCFNEMTIDYQLYNLWRAWGGGIDPDAQAFIDVSGATDIQGINNFVKGIKALGLWSSMVCWPLRSSQNAGTGSTAYSLGGLGTYNGTLINGPTWGADGVNFASASDQRIDVSTSLVFSPTTVPFNAMTVQNATSISGSHANLFGRGKLNDSLSDISWALRATTTTSQPQISDGTAQTLYNVSGNSLNTFKAFQMFSESDLIRANIDAGSFTTGAARTPNQDATHTLRIGTTITGTLYFDGKISFALFGNSASANSAALYALYKSTLGQGLGLP
jgi:hypothetical protein